MVQKEIEQTYEQTEVKTDTTTVTFCDGCTDEIPDDSEDAVVLSNISIDCLTSLDSKQEVETLIENAEEFDICPGCQKGLREHGRTIDTALYDAPEGDGEQEPFLTDRTKKNLSALGLAIMAILSSIMGLTALYSAITLSFGAMIVSMVALLACTYIGRFFARQHDKYV